MGAMIPNMGHAVVTGGGTNADLDITFNVATFFIMADAVDGGFGNLSPDGGTTSVADIDILMSSIDGAITTAGSQFTSPGNVGVQPEIQIDAVTGDTYDIFCTPSATVTNGTVSWAVRDVTMIDSWNPVQTAVSEKQGKRI